MAMNAKARDKQRRKRKAARKQRKADENHNQVQNTLKWLIDERIFVGISLHGNTSWQCSSLVCLAMLWVWSTTPQLTEAFVDARSKAEKLLVPITITTYQGLMKALVSVTPKLMPVLQKRMHDLMSKIGGKHLRVGRWVPIAVDGSKETAPRTASNEAALRAKNYGQGKNAKNRKRKLPLDKKQTAKKIEQAKPKKATKPKKAIKPKTVSLPPPQVWVTMMWHMGLGLPWCWKLGPSNASERNHVKEMLENGHFLLNTLFVGDAGFVGYEFWRAIIDAGHHFMVRVGANVNLLTGLCTVERDGKDIVYCWPQTTMNANKPPLRLRLVKCKIGKNEKVWLLTSVLNRRDLSNKAMAKLYKRRWGVELQFRALKQTFDRRKVRCRCPERVLTEIEWSIFGMAAVELMALKEQMKDADARPEKLSFSQALTALRHSLNNLTDRPEFLNDLYTGLRRAIIDSYERKRLKSGRYKPKRKNKPSCGEPKTELATAYQRQRHREISLQNAA
jgi:hypothetical protein